MHEVAVPVYGYWKKTVYEIQVKLTAYYTKTLNEYVLVPKVAYL